MRPAEILDAQRDLLERLQYNPLFAAHQALAAAAVMGLKANARYQAAEMKAGRSLGGEAWVNAMTQHVRAAYAYRVTPDMCMVLEQAAATLDESDEFNRDLAPTGCGIVRFEKPLHIRDARGKDMLIHWAIWGPANVRSKSGLAFTFFNDHWTEPDSGFEDYKEWVTQNHPETEPEQEVYEQAMSAVGRWMSAHQAALADGESLGATTVDPDPTQQAQIIATGGTPHPATNLGRFMHALFLLLNQTIVEIEEEFPDRHARKRAVRAGLPPKVSVIRLRRSQVTNRRKDESLVEWSHRWIVRNHWRWQPYGPRRSDHEHNYGPAVVERGGLVRHCTHEGCPNHVARILINAYVKGPEDAPLTVSDKLYSLER